MNKLYIITRADLDPGLLAAQACHAAFQFAHYCPDAFEEWQYQGSKSRFREPGGGNLILLSVPDEAALLALVHKSTAEFLECATFQEPDLGGSLTAIALAGKGAEKLTGSLPRALRPPKAA